MARFHTLKVKDIRRETSDAVSVAFEVPPQQQPEYQRHHRHCQENAAVPRDERGTASESEPDDGGHHAAYQESYRPVTPVGAAEVGRIDLGKNVQQRHRDEQQPDRIPCQCQETSLTSGRVDVVLRLQARTAIATSVLGQRDLASGGKSFTLNNLRIALGHPAGASSSLPRRVLRTSHNIRHGCDTGAPFILRSGQDFASSGGMPIARAGANRLPEK